MDTGGKMRTESGRKLSIIADRVMVKAKYKAETTESGIYIPETTNARTYTQKGEIVQMAEDVELENCELGDQVYFIRGIGEYDRSRYKIKNEEYYVFPYTKILAKVGKNGLKACNGMAIAPYPKLDETTASGLILPTNQKDQRQLWLAEVLDIDGGKEVKNGDKVYVSFFYIFRHNEKEYVAIPQDDIHAKEEA